ncbi:MAG: ABC transporter ATP-binding protein [Acholeplasmataceae bacterium]
MSYIQVDNLYKTFHKSKFDVKVLKDINLKVDENEFVSIVGPSGSGKTTLLYVLSGLETYDRGSLLLFDKEMKSYTEKEKADLRSFEIGFVFQFYHLIPNLTVYENVELAAVIGKQASKSAILETLKMVGMEQEKDSYPAQLSGGQQQRVAIARALINDPKIIFADEPTGNLDYQTGLQIMELFQSLHKNQHKTIFMVTHNMDTTKYGTRILSMLSGKVIKDEKNNS